jgi:ABC-2 type transport system ATP-binding protein
MIETVDLTKKYGDFVALDGLDLKLAQGDLFGFIGPNGAGKTTTIRILSTLLAPTWGEAYVCGHSIYTHPREVRRAIGYMPDIFGVYDDMRVIEYLEFFAATYRIDGPARRRVAEESLELVDLVAKRDELVTSLSRGMTQRLGLARVLLHDPQVQLLDEPMSGLDPRARRDLRTALQSLAATGATILISSHILSELSEMCTSLCILNRGRLLAHGSVNEVRSQLGNTRRRLTLGLLSPPSEAADWLAQQPTISELRVESARISFEFTGDDEAQAELLEALVLRRVRLRTFEERRSSLEELLIDIATPPPLP